MAISLAFARRRQQRRGSAVILTALAIVPLLAMLAFAVDWGRICLTKAELQRAADAAAMAGALELRLAQGPASRLSPAMAESEAREAASEYSAMNTALGKKLKLQPGDIEVGYLANPLEPEGPLDTSNPEQFNAVRVRVRRDAGSNGAIPMFFARVLGKADAKTNSSATAAFIGNVSGFRQPISEGPNGPYLPLLPFALHVKTWHAAVNGQGPDQWKWDRRAGKFVFGSDGVPEFNLYPQDTGAPGNYGIVKIGTSVPSTPHVARQIVKGVSRQDLEYHNGSLTFNENGELYLDGTPGLRAGLERQLSAIRGQGRIVPVYSRVDGTGDNSVYTIVEWAGVRIIEVQLSGNDKRVIVQAGEVTAVGTVPSPSKGKSKFVFSRVWLTR